MVVLVERNIQQVVDGSHYKGTVKIGGTAFDYEQKFLVPIPHLDDMVIPANAEEVRRLFPIAITKNGTAIELTPDEYGFFFTILSEFAVKFYLLQQTRHAQHTVLATNSLFTLVGATVSIGMADSALYKFPLEVCSTLNAEKFGCALSA